MFKFDTVHLNNLVHPIIKQALHVLIKFRIKSGNVDLFNSLATFMELSVVLVIVLMDLGNVAMFIIWVPSDIIKKWYQLPICRIGIKGGKMHSGLVKKGSSKLFSVIAVNLIVNMARKYVHLGLFLQCHIWTFCWAASFWPPAPAPFTKSSQAVLRVWWSVCSY